MDITTATALLVGGTWITPTTPIEVVPGDTGWPTGAAARFSDETSSYVVPLRQIQAVKTA